MREEDSRHSGPLPAIELARRLSGMRLREIAEKSGYSISHLHHVLHGRRRASTRLITALRDLGVLQQAEARARSLLVALESQADDC